MATPAFVSVSFVDPWGIVPPGTQSTGVLCTIGNPASAPAGYVLIAQLLQGVSPIAYGLGGSASFVFVTPPGPLTASLPFQVQVQWAPPGTDPANADWTVPGIASAPVITSGATLVGGTVSAGNVALAWTPVGATAPSTGIVQLLNVGPGQIKVVSAQGGAGSWPWTPAEGASYAAYVSAAALVSPSVPNVYTSGPLAPPVSLPTAAPALSSVAYDGARLSVAWTPPALPASPAPAVAEASYSLLLLSGGIPVGVFPASSGGGTAVADLAAMGGTLSVAGAVSYGPFGGPAGTSQGVIAFPPTLSSVTMAAGQEGATAITASLTAPPGPSGTAVQAALYENGAKVAAAAAQGSPLQATLSYVMAAGKSYTLTAQASIAGPPTVGGPATDPVPLVAGPVQNLTAAYDGARLNLGWTAVADPALTGYGVTVTGLPQAAYATGPEPLLSIPATLAVGATATVTVTPLSGMASGVAAAPLAFTVPAPAAPQIVDAAVEGDVLALAWSPSAGPWMDGYRVTATATALAGGATLQTVTLYTGLETSLSFALPATLQAAQWSVTVAATARGTAGPAATAVTLFPAVPVITAVTGSAASAQVAWSLAPGTDAVLTLLSEMGAAVQVLVRDGENAVAAASTAVSTSSATGTTTVALPSPVTARLTATARLAVAAQAGSPAGPVAVLAAQPAVAFGTLDDTSLTLSWSASGDEGVTGYTVACAGVSVTAAGTEAVVPLPAGGVSAGGAVTLQPVGANAAGPQVSRSVVAAPAVAWGAYDGATLSVTLGAAGTPTPAQLHVDVRVDGAVVARAVTAGAPGSAVSVPVALPAGSPATVRATGVGSGSLTPPGTAVAIPTSAAGGVSGVWDGTSLHVGWEPTGDAGVTGYLVSVAGADPAVQPTYVAGADAAAASIAAAFPGAFPGSAAVSVQASTLVTTGNRIDGPGGAAAVPVLAGSVRGVAAAASAQPPYVYRIGAYTSLAAAQGSNVVVYLANVFLGGTPTARDSTGSPTFTLAPVTTPVAAEAAYSLSIDGSVWTSFDGSAARAPLRDAYIAFLKAVEALGVQTWGIALVRQAVAAALPQTFAETLYYRYGLWQQTSLRVVDLEPGVRLRISGAVYQTPSGSSDPRNGYVVVGTETFDLAEIFPAGSAQSGLAPALTVDAFLSQLFPGSGGQGTVVAAGPLDFLVTGARQAYFRLFYPPSFLSSGAIGSSSPTGNVAVLGAPSWTALEAATETYASTGNFPTGGSLFTAYFRGRAALTPLLAASVNGAAAWVPVGSTLRQALATLGAAPAFGAGDSGAVSLTRLVADVFDYAQGGAPVRAEAVSLSTAAIGDLLPQLWPLDVPLLGGDTVAVAPAVPPGS
jgi:hypothetical protein